MFKPIRSNDLDSIKLTASCITLFLKKRTSASMNKMYGVVTNLAPLFFAIETGPPSMISTFNKLLLSLITCPVLSVEQSAMIPLVSPISSLRSESHK